MFEITMPIGDWSNDGHGRCDEVDFMSNYDVHALRVAYIESVKRTDVSFDHETDRTATQLCTEYEDDGVPVDVIRKFVEFGYVMTDDDKANTYNGVISFSSEEFGKLILWFIGLSMPDDWEYAVKEQTKKVYLNGYWNEELNVGFGYGLFY